MKKDFLVTVLSALFCAGPVFAANGDLIVDGKIGIGTTAPTETLSISNATAIRAVVLEDTASDLYNSSLVGRRARGAVTGYTPVQQGDWLFTIGAKGYGAPNPTTGTSDFSTGALINFVADEAFVTSSKVGTYMTFATGSKGSGNVTEVMRLTSGGNVAIGATDTGGYKLYVNGTMWSSNTAGSGSDIRFKKEILPIDSALATVLNLRGVSYQWRRDEFKDKNFAEGRHLGVIAQEVERVLPEVVKTDSDGYKAVFYTEIIPVLIEAIKEQQKEIEELKKRLPLR